MTSQHATWMNELLAMALLAATAARAGSGTDSELRTRGYFGFAYLALTQDHASAAGVDPEHGVSVHQVLAGGPAERAGIHIGDVVLRMGTHPVTGGILGFQDLLRGFYSGEPVDVEVARGHARVTCALVAEAPPREHAEDIDIEYTSFMVAPAPGESGNPVRLRAVITSPAGSAGRKLPALLIVTALGSTRLIEMPGYSLTVSLAHTLARSGYRVLRFELRGSGDSEGVDYRTLGFTSEVQDNLAAIDFLRSRPDVDPGRVFVFGHSTGGMEAALLAAQRPVAGLITSSTIGRTFYERMADTLRLQGVLNGDTPAHIDQTISEHLAFATAIAEGQTREQLLERHPGRARFFNAAGRIMDDRTLEFWREQLILNLGETYSRIKAPVLILWGESDFLTQRACHERIRDVLLASGNTDVELHVIADLDHAFARAATPAQSHTNYATGDFVENPVPMRLMADWLDKHRQKRFIDSCMFKIGKLLFPQDPLARPMGGPYAA